MRERSLLLLFGSSRLDNIENAVEQLRQRFPGVLLAGCSTAGEIKDDLVYDGTIAALALEFEETGLASVSAQIAGADGSRVAGAVLGRALSQRDGLRAVLVLSVGLNVNGTQIAQGLNSALPEGVLVTGGLAGDGTAFARTWTVCDEGLCEDRVVAVGFYGDRVQLSHGCRGGWQPFGPRRAITKATENVLFELDGEPALALYKKYLGPEADALPSSGLLFPLQIQSPDDPDRALTRTLLAVDEGEQSLTFAGNLPVGWTAQLMRADFETLVEGAHAAGLQARLSGDADETGDVACVAISCVGRRLVLGSRVDDEIRALRDTLPENARIAGFYSYGEISPLVIGDCELHNQTMTLTLIRER